LTYGLGERSLVLGEKLLGLLLKLQHLLLELGLLLLIGVRRSCASPPTSLQSALFVACRGTIIG
jgi:hypothetical protein